MDDRSTIALKVTPRLLRVRLSSAHNCTAASTLGRSCDLLVLRVLSLFFRRRNKVTEAAATVTPEEVETVSQFDSYTAAR